MTTINREAWSKVCSRTANGAEVDFDATVANLRRYIDLQKHDQQAMAQAIDAVFKECASHSHITTPNVLKVAAMKLTSDFSLWSELEERGRDVLKASYTTEKKNGIVNPYFVKPAT